MQKTHRVVGSSKTKCDCSDYITYFRSDIKRPIKGENISDKEFEELLCKIKIDDIKNLMIKERYKSVIFQLIPYEYWNKLINDKNMYLNILN